MNHHIMARFWWILVGRGAVGILLGLTALAAALYLNMRPEDPYGLSQLLAPFASLVVLLLVLGLYAFLDGLFSVVLGIQDFGHGRHWWGLFLEGCLSIALGVWTWLKPDPTVTFLFYWIALWAFVTGFSTILQAFNPTEYRDRKKQFLTAGLCSVAFGSLVLFLPTGADRMVWLIGIYSFLFAVPLLVMGFRLRHYVKRVSV